jgi:CHC2 zinc finger
MAIIASSWTMTATGNRIDWHEVRDRIDPAAVATNLLGPAAKRQGPRLLWPCPFHDDHDPSFQVDLTRKSWRCWVCGVGGDAAELVKRFNKCGFPAAVKYLAELSGAIAPQSKVRGQEPKNPIPREVSDLGFGTIAKRVSPPPEQPSGLPPDEASTLVDEATACLWGPGGKSPLAYLHGRGLTDETIRATRLGYTPAVSIPTRAGDRFFLFSGIVIPWRDGARLTRIKIRRIDDGKRKYAEAFQDRPLIFPDPAVIRPGEPLIICEGNSTPCFSVNSCRRRASSPWDRLVPGPTRPCSRGCCLPLAGSSLWTLTRLATMPLPSSPPA